MSKKNSKKAFVDAVRSRGGVRYFDLGGSVTPTATPTLAPQPKGDFFSDAFNAVAGVNPYKAQLAPTTQYDYGSLLSSGQAQGQQALGQQQGNLASEQALQQQLLAQAAGQGPNPAQAALNQNTGVNVANQAALMANQRGGSANAGLLARQVGQQGAQTQQQAVGQGATLQAQQQLAAQQGAAALQGQIGQQLTSQQEVGNQLIGLGANSNNAQNSGLTGNYQMAQGINSGNSQNNANAVSGLIGGAAKGVSSAAAGPLAALFAAKGGEIHSGRVSYLDAPHFAQGGPVSQAGQFLMGGAAPMMSKGGTVKAMVSPGEKVLPPNKVGSATPLKDAVPVPGKAKVKGDSLKNDVVPADLPEGAIVLPRSVTQHKDAPRKAADFVRAIHAKQGLKRGKKR